MNRQMVIDAPLVSPLYFLRLDWGVLVGNPVTMKYILCARLFSPPLLAVLFSLLLERIKAIGAIFLVGCVDGILLPFQVTVQVPLLQPQQGVLEMLKPK